jgi:hypothetical protein
MGKGRSPLIVLSLSSKSKDTPVQPFLCTNRFLMYTAWTIAPLAPIAATMPRPIPFHKLRPALFSLTLEQAKELQQVLSEIIRTLETAQPPTVKARQGREVVEVVHRGDRLYQRELIKCGKLGCKCMTHNGKLHGPYWYVYWREDGTLKSKYIGKQLKEDS